MLLDNLRGEDYDVVGGNSLSGDIVDMISIVTWCDWNIRIHLCMPYTREHKH